MKHNSNSPFKSQIRNRSDLNKLWFGQGRARMIEVAKNLGITDVCECQDWNSANSQESKNAEWRFRTNSGPVGMKECKHCKHLLWPLSYVYDCDDCTEPTLSDKYPVGVDEDFLCFDCQIESLGGK